MSEVSAGRFVFELRASTARLVLRPVMSTLICVVLAHLPFWVVQARLFELRPVFSYDILILLLIGALLRRPVIGVVLLCWVLDGFQSVATSFHFANAADFAGTIRFARLLHFSDFLSTDVVFLIALFVGGALLLAWGLRRMRVQPLMLAVLMTLVAGLDIVNGSTRLPGAHRDYVFVSVNIAGSPLWNMANRLWLGRAVASPGPAVWQPEPVSYAVLKEWASSRPQRSALLVVVESMGLAHAQGMREVLQTSLRSALPADRWSIESGEERFSGGTTYGELRVLCGLNGRYQSFRDGTADASPCLPVQMAARGIDTVGMHGFTAQMFDRQLWWPRVGLRIVRFAEDLAHDDNRCGDAFRGVCDRALVQEAVKRLSPAPSFVYALTLNTHLPMKDGPIDPVVGQLCLRLQVPHLPCLLIARHAELMRDISVALRDSPERPLVVIVGDHAPPFGDVGNREAFWTDRVPVFVVRPLQ